MVVLLTEETVMVATTAVAALVMIYFLYKNRRGASQVCICQGKGGLEKIDLRHKSGAFAEVYAFGGTVTKYVTADGVDMLWVSNSAKFDGKKAIRGGIPLVYPQFGPKADSLLGVESMSQHGFARISHWEIVSTLTEVRVDSGDCQATLRLRENKETTKIWPHKFELTYIVRLSATALRTELRITNLDDAPVQPQALLHTYYRTDDISDVRVSGLATKSKFDQLTSTTTTQDATPISFTKEFDCVFDGGIKTTADSLDDSGKITVSSLGSKAKLRINIDAAYIEEFGEACAAPRLFNPDVVVWNPHINKAKAMSDFDDDGWTKMFCVEPGILNSRRPVISPGNSVILGQTIFDDRHGGD